MSLFTGRMEGTVERALDAVSLRQRVTADNIANAMTPGYRAKRVDFEAALTAASKSGTPESSAVSVRDAGNPARLDGNSVVIEDEVRDQLRTGLHYQALVQAANFNFSQLRTAIEGR